MTSGMFSEIFTIYIVPEYQRGDIDGDGEVTVKDARYALRQAVGLIELAVNSKPYTAADPLLRYMRTGTALFPCGTRVSFCAAPWDLKSFLLRSVSTVKG